MVGCQFHEASRAFMAAQEGKDLTGLWLCGEPDNPYDKDALAVCWQNGKKRGHSRIGHVSAKKCKAVKRFLVRHNPQGHEVEKWRLKDFSKKGGVLQWFEVRLTIG